MPCDIILIVVIRFCLNNQMPCDIILIGVIRFCLDN